MKARIVPIDAVELFAADGTSLGHFLCVSRWEGFAKFQSVKGDDVGPGFHRNGPAETFVCVEPQGMAATFERMFARIDMTRKIDTEVVMGTPSLLKALMPKETESAS